MDIAKIPTTPDNWTIVCIAILTLFLLVVFSICFQMCCMVYRAERDEKIKKHAGLGERYLNQMVRTNFRTSRHMYVLRGTKGSPSEMFDV